MEVSNETVVKKPKRLTSVVWNHFERVKNSEICYAVCVHCNKRLSGSSNSGTTHLRNHLMRCLKRSNFDVSQLLAAKRRKKDGTVTVANTNFDEARSKDENISSAVIKYDQEQRKDENYNFGGIKLDQERSRLDLARMIILHGYPLAMVEHVGFKIFVKNLQPWFEAGPNGAIEVVCMELYEKEKLKVFEIIRTLHSRINLAIDMWTSHENAGYMCLTAHYIDEDWILRKKILNFVTLDSFFTEDMLSDVLVRYLVDWDIDRKLFAITFDNILTKDENVGRIKDWLSQSRPLLSNGQFFDVRCAANVLKLIVQDAMEALRDVTQKIRESVRHVKSSQATLGKFNEIAQQVGTNSQTSLLLDCPVRWDSTYNMLKIAVEFRAAFSILQEHDPTYQTALSDDEWERASSIAGYLKLLVEVTTSLSSNKCATANIYFPEICDIHIQLLEWCKSSDDFLKSLALTLKDTFDKYWSKCSLALAVAAILDPRFKMKLVEYYYPQIYGGSASESIKNVSDGMRELFNAYAIGPSSSSLDQSLALPCSSLPSTSNDTRDRLKGFDKFLHETSQSQGVKSDLDKYLEEPVFPRNSDFNILNWWKVHTARYPILSMIARDVLGIPMSTVAPESVFNTESRVLHDFRTSLNQDTRQALICSQDWLRAEYEESKLSSSHSAVPFMVES